MVDGKTRRRKVPLAVDFDGHLLVAGVLRAHTLGGLLTSELGKGAIAQVEVRQQLGCAHAIAAVDEELVAQDGFPVRALLGAETIEVL